VGGAVRRARDDRARRPRGPATPPLAVHVRLCREDDLPRLEWLGLFTPHRAIIREAFARQRAGDNVMLVGEAGGFPVAQAWIDLARLRAERAGLLWAVRVFPGLRGAGIGSRLIAAAEEVLRRLRFAEAEIGVEKDNPAARRLYERLGYAVVRDGREEYDYTPPGGAPVRVALDEWFLRKRLVYGRRSASTPRAPLIPARNRSRTPPPPPPSADAAPSPFPRAAAPPRR
jgi:ribosomal protein S18 acetylase RimI-like enzyme